MAWTGASYLVNSQYAEEPPVTSDPSAPIGVFDSGAGGLTVVRALLERLPCERFVYFGDTAYVPYGPRAPEQIRQFALDACRFLRAQGAKIIVMGCNMSSALALAQARSASGIPVLGTIEAGARAAVAATRTGRIGVAATEGTVKSGAYLRAICALRPDVTVFQQACPVLVPAIEAGTHDGMLDQVVALSLRPLRDLGPDTVVLGCTHYPLVRAEIQSFFGSEVQLVDPAERLAEETAQELTRSGLIAPDRSGPAIECFASGPPESLATWAERTLAITLRAIQQIDIHRG